MELDKSEFRADSDDLLTNKAIGYDIEPRVGDTAYVEYTDNINIPAKDKYSFAGRYKITSVGKDKITMVSLFDIYGDNDPSKERPADFDKYTELDDKKITISLKDVFKRFFHAHSNMWVFYVLKDSDVNVDVQKMEKTKPALKKGEAEKKGKANVDTYGKSDKKTEKMTKVGIEKTGKPSGKANIDTYFDSKGKPA